MINLKTCPQCSKENQPTANLCVYCGTPLNPGLPSGTTVRVPDYPTKSPSHQKIEQLTALYTDIIAVLVADQDEPILVKGGSNITIGRYSYTPGEVPPTIDLSPYNANLQGVSRQHATISRSNNEYVLRDLGSTNGSWLNETRLSPEKSYTLKNGDQLRLGQLIMHIYFNSVDFVETVEETVKLKHADATVTNRKLTPADLEKSIAPYLSALAGVQAICSQLLDKKVAQVAISSITADLQNGHVVVKIDGVQDALRFVRTKLPTWRERFQEELSTHLKNGTSETSLPDTLVQGEKELGLEFLSSLDSDMTEDEKKTHWEKFAPHLRVLTLTTLQLI